MSHAGVASLVELTDRVGLTAALSEALAVTRERRSSPTPSAVTSTVPRRAFGFTNWVSSWAGIGTLSNPDSHGPGGCSQNPTSACYRRFGARSCPGMRPASAVVPFALAGVRLAMRTDRQ